MIPRGRLPSKTNVACSQYSKNFEGEDLFEKCIEDENEELMNYYISKGLKEKPENLPQFRFESGEDQYNDTISEDENEDEDDEN